MTKFLLLALLALSLCSGGAYRRANSCLLTHYYFCMQCKVFMLPSFHVVPWYNPSSINIKFLSPSVKPKLTQLSTPRNESSDLRFQPTQPSKLLWLQPVDRTLPPCDNPVPYILIYLFRSFAWRSFIQLPPGILFYICRWKLNKLPLVKKFVKEIAENYEGAHIYTLSLQRYNDVRSLHSLRK